MNGRWIAWTLLVVVLTACTGPRSEPNTDDADDPDAQERVEGDAVTGDADSSGDPTDSASGDGDPDHTPDENGDEPVPLAAEVVASVETHGPDTILVRGGLDEARELMVEWTGPLPAAPPEDDHAADAWLVVTTFSNRCPYDTLSAERRDRTVALTAAEPMGECDDASTLHTYLVKLTGLIDGDETVEFLPWSHDEPLVASLITDDAEPRVEVVSSVNLPQAEAEVRVQTSLNGAMEVISEMLGQEGTPAEDARLPERAWLIVTVTGIRCPYANMTAERIDDTTVVLTGGAEGGECAPEPTSFTHVVHLSGLTHDDATVEFHAPDQEPLTATLPTVTDDAD